MVDKSRGELSLNLIEFYPDNSTDADQNNLSDELAWTNGVDLHDTEPLKHLKQRNNYLVKATFLVKTNLSLSETFVINTATTFSKDADLSNLATALYPDTVFVAGSFSSKGLIYKLELKPITDLVAHAAYLTLEKRLHINF